MGMVVKGCGKMQFGGERITSMEYFDRKTNATTGTMAVNATTGTTATNATMRRPRRWGLKTRMRCQCRKV